MERLQNQNIIMVLYVNISLLAYWDDVSNRNRDEYIN